MSEIESNQFNQMFKQHGEMYNAIMDLREEIVGNKEFQRPGLIGEIKALKKAAQDHDESDKEKFQQIFAFQDKQKWLVGWAGIGLRLLGGAIIVLIGWIISIFFH